jgi:hypothetical protein
MATTIGCTMTQTFGFIFKLYLFLYKNEDGTLIILLLFTSGIFIVLSSLYSFILKFFTKKREYHLFGYFWVPLVTLVEKASAIMFITTMFLEWKLYFLWMHIPFAVYNTILTQILIGIISKTTDQIENDNSLNEKDRKKMLKTIASVVGESVVAVYPAYGIYETISIKQEKDKPIVN